MSFKGRDVPLFYLFFLLLDVNVIAGAPAAIFDYEVTLGIELIHVGVTDGKAYTVAVPYHLWTATSTLLHDILGFSYCYHKSLSLPTEPDVSQYKSLK